MSRMERKRQSDRVLDDELDRDLAALPVHEPGRDLAPGVIAALRFIKWGHFADHEPEPEQ